MKISVFVIFAVLALSGCARLCPEPKVSVNPDQLAFEEACAGFQQSNKVVTLENFIAVYPDSPWAGRARTLVLYARELEQRKEQLKQQQKTLAEQEARLEILSQENRELAETIERLKGSLIELEKRPQ